MNKKKIPILSSQNCLGPQSTIWEDNLSVSMYLNIQVWNQEIFELLGWEVLLWIQAQAATFCQFPSHEGCLQGENVLLCQLQLFLSLGTYTYHLD